MMNAIGIDVSKGKSTIAIMKPFGEVVIPIFEINHSQTDLKKLVEIISSLNGESRVVMEATGNYHFPIANYLCEKGVFVSVVNAMLVYGYSNNSLRKAKTDKKDAVKLANYAIDRWNTLTIYSPSDDLRNSLKICYRQYQQYVHLNRVEKNNLISLLEQCFPNANQFFKGNPKIDGSEKWIDFLHSFWHRECVCRSSLNAFSNRYLKWCKKNGYKYSFEKAEYIYLAAKESVTIMPKNDTTKFIVLESINQIRATNSTVFQLKNKMQYIASKLPEYDVVMQMYGVGPCLGPQLMAEIGDVRRFYSKKALIAYAGIDAPPYQSGSINIKSRSISKRGSSALRRTLFLVMSTILQNSPPNEPVYQYLDKKRAEGKPYRVYMMASANKFLRIYYARVKACLDN